MPRGQPEILAGRNSVREALRAGRRHVDRVMLAEGVGEKGTVADIARMCQDSGVTLTRVDRSALDRLGDDIRHQGVAAQVSAYPYVDLEAILTRAKDSGERPFLLALDSLQDPQNVGALLRTAEAVGVHGLLLPQRRSVGITPAVSRASAGAVEHLHVATVTNLSRTLDSLKAEGVWAVGLEDDPRAQDYRQVDLNLPMVLVVGGEGEGMRRLVRETCDLLVRIPMRGRIESLNVAVAGSIALYSAWAAREPSGIK